MDVKFPVSIPDARSVAAVDRLDTVPRAFGVSCVWPNEFIRDDIPGDGGEDR